MRVSPENTMPQGPMEPSAPQISTQAMGPGMPPPPPGAFGGQGAPQGGREGVNPEYTGADVDTNADGAISLQELDMADGGPMNSADGLFQELDADGNGTVTVAEYDQGMADQGDGLNFSNDILSLLDQNGDGAVDNTELAALDVDGDGEISLNDLVGFAVMGAQQGGLGPTPAAPMPDVGMAEAPVPAEPLNASPDPDFEAVGDVDAEVDEAATAASPATTTSVDPEAEGEAIAEPSEGLFDVEPGNVYDLDGNGSISEAELFAAIDQNGDGTVDQAEVEALDANGDGEVTEEEVQDFVAQGAA